MKKTQLIDACRNVRKELVAFLSIVVIGMLAAVAYLSIAYAAATLEKDANIFFNGSGLWDFQVSSTLLMDDEDLEAIRALPGVGAAEAVLQTGAQLRIGRSMTDVTVMDVPEEITRPVLLSGRLPETAGECAIEKKLADDGEFSVGQTISLTNRPVMGIEPLKETDFVITGVFQTPEHISYMVSVTPYVLVSKESFNREELQGSFMTTLIRVADAPEDRYSDAYWDAVRPVEEALQTLAEERGPARREKIRGIYETQIRTGEQKIDEAKAQIRTGEQKIDEGKAQMQTAREKLDEGWRQLADQEKLTEPVPVLLDQGAAKLRLGEEEIERIVGVLEGLGIHVNGSTILERVEDLRRMLDNATVFWERARDSDLLPEPAREAYEELIRKYGNMSAEDVLRKVEEETGLDLSEERERLKKLRSGADEYERGINDYYYSGEQYLDAVTAIEKGRRLLEEGERGLAEGQEKLCSAEKQISEAKEQLCSAEEQISEAKEKMNQIGECRWVVLNDKGNAGYTYARANSDKLMSMSTSFSSIFLIVGALVIYATITRMVEQQRTLVGAAKAMGLYNGEIFAKYLFFAAAAVMLGVGLGILLAWLPVQGLILRSYEAHLNYGRGTDSFLPVHTGLVAAGAFLISLAAVWLGCRQLLRLTAIQLMSGKTPDKGKRKSRSSSGGRLYSRLILRNMWTDRVRVLVTIVSIAGGCVLMTVGFTLYFGISGVTDRQFGGIQTYEAEVFYDTGENEDAEAEIETLLEEDGLQHIRVRKKDGVFEVDGTLDALTLIVAEKGSMDGYFDLRSIETGEKLDLSDEGVLVPRRFWESHGEKLDGKVPVYNADMDRVEIPIVGVFENYFGQVFFLTPEGYESCFQTAPVANCFLVRTDGLSLDDLRERLEPVKGLERVRDAAADRVTIEQFSQSLTFVVVFMLFLAGMMACFIVANFTVTYIQRKTKELTIMRVNGFSSGECIRYAAADLIVTTALGTLIGLAAGSWLGARILGTTETPYIQMIREPNVKTFLYSGLITIGFSAITNSIVLQRIRRLKISDINS